MPGVRSAYPLCSPPPQQLLTKQDSLDIYNERDLFKNEEPAAEEEEELPADGELDLLEQDPLVPPPPSQAPLSADRVAFPKGLPWAPKVR